MDDALCEMTALELSGAYARREASPVEAIRQVLHRAETVGAGLNAFCATDADAALAAARGSEKRWLRGEPLGRLDGVPLSVKDNLGVAGMPTRFGSRAVSGDRAQLPDSPSVSRLREAGAVVFAKTTMPDFAHKIVTDSPLTGVTRNPWNPAHTPGGSSGGSSAAVAARIGPLTLGTDGGGSIRVPSSFAGIFGLKPSFGRVPHHPRGAFAPMSHVGPMTLDVDDAALMMNAIARPDSRDWYALPYQEHDYLADRRSDLRGLRVAYSPGLGLDIPVDADVAAAVRRAAGVFERLGATVVEADPPLMKRCREIHGLMWVALSARLADSLGEDAALLDRSLLALAEAGRTIPRSVFVDAWLERGDIGSRICQFFDSHDLVLAPVFHTPAPAIAGYEKGEPPIPTFTNWCNQTGLPAASIHCGLSSGGLPIGLQVAGGRHADAMVMSACRVFERAVGKAPRAPRP